MAEGPHTPPRNAASSIGFDNHPSAWVFYTGIPLTGNDVTVTVNGKLKLYTVQAGDTLDDIAREIVDLFVADSGFTADFLSRKFQNISFFRSKTQGDKESGTPITATVVQGGGTGLTMAVETNAPTLQRMFKAARIEADREDLRVGSLSVTGEMGVRNRAKNPIFVSVRKNVAALNETLFFDQDVTGLDPDPNIDIAYIQHVLVADDVAAEVRIYKGLFRNRVENKTGDGSTIEFGLDYKAVEVASHISVEVDAVPQTILTDYTVIDDPNDDSKSKILFDSPVPGAPANDADIEITYDATERVLVAFVQSSSSEPFTFGSPIKLEKDKGHFLVATVINKSANASVVAVNANGFFETVKELL